MNVYGRSDRSEVTEVNAPNALATRVEAQVEQATVAKWTPDSTDALALRLDEAV